MDFDKKESSVTPPSNVPDITEPTDESLSGDSEPTTGVQSPLQNQNSANEKISFMAAVGQVKMVDLMGVPIVALTIDGQERLCLAQISSTLLKQYSYNEIHNRRVALGITCVQCTPVQLEILRRAGAMPVSSRRCGMITKREAERLCKSFLSDNAPPKLPDHFTFDVQHQCAWGCRGNFMPSRYNSSRAKCVQCVHCRMFFSPNKFIFHSHRFNDSSYTQPDAANFNSWRRHLHLVPDVERPEHITHAWEDVKAMFNGGTRKRFLFTASSVERHSEPKRKSSDAPTNEIYSQTEVPPIPNPHHEHSPSFSTLNLKKSQQRNRLHSTPTYATSNFHQSLYRGPTYYPQQFLQDPTSTSFNWLYGPHHVHPFAALASAAAVAAATAQSSSAVNASSCWFPYGPYLHSPMTSMLASTSSASTSLLAVRGDSSLDTITATGDTPEETVSNERKNVEYAKREESGGTYEHMTKEKLQQMLVSEIRTRQRLEQDLDEMKTKSK